MNDIKIVLLGDSGVGKTNLLTRFIKDKFEENPKTTIGTDISNLDLLIKNKTIKANFWDTSGQEKYRALSKNYYKNSNGAIIIYDITNKKTFFNIKKWLLDLREFTDETKIIILGNKNDLNDLREVNFQEAKNFADKENCFFEEISVKDNFGKIVHKVIDLFLEEVFSSMRKYEASEKTIKKKFIGKGKIEKYESKGCC